MRAASDDFIKVTNEEDAISIFFRNQKRSYHSKLLYKPRAARLGSPEFVPRKGSERSEVRVGLVASCFV